MLAELQADRSRLADLEAQILPLERAISVLRAEQALLQERLESYKYPVLTLPNEIMSEIFKHFPSRYPPLTGPLSPTHLTRICRKWREIALATPVLWSALSLYISHLSTVEEVHERSDVWLKRSGSCPLTIFITSFRRHVGCEMFPGIVAHRTRWEHLKLYVCGLDLSTIDGPMPLLRHLDVELLEKSPTVLAFHDVPLLRTVILDHYACASVTLPWVQLTSLVLTDVGPSQCSPILQQTTNLVHCELEIGVEDDDLDVAYLPDRDITLPYLDSLVLTNPDGETVHVFLNSFVVPGLRRLTLEEEFLGSSPIKSLARFISKSSCVLQEVHITGERRVHEDSYILAFPSVPNFSFKGPYLEETINNENSGDEIDSEDVESDSFDSE
ncbi:F-box domain-containing protein [Mycena venus]|uniref:F-box domain-containing protein n=1 Tax=Mycena venus TaxID=2733690 RepID=A0A8H6Y5Z3_9AGAR|nr:F-box domain-containing protein [Mycena venus]